MGTPSTDLFLRKIKEWVPSFEWLQFQKFLRETPKEIKGSLLGLWENRKILFKVAAIFVILPLSVTTLHSVVTGHSEVSSGGEVSVKPPPSCNSDEEIDKLLGLFTNHFPALEDSRERQEEMFGFFVIQTTVEKFGCLPNKERVNRSNDQKKPSLRSGVIKLIITGGLIRITFSAPEIVRYFIGEKLSKQPEADKVSPDASKSEQESLNNKTPLRDSPNNRPEPSTK